MQEKMELTSHAPHCYAALDLPLTKFGKSAAFISPNVHFIMARLRYRVHRPMTDRQPPPPPAEQRRAALLMQSDGRRRERSVQK